MKVGAYPFALGVQRFDVSLHLVRLERLPCVRIPLGEDTVPMPPVRPLVQEVLLERQLARLACGRKAYDVS